VAHCSHPGHQLDDYTDDQRQLLASIADLNAALLDAYRSGTALAGVLATIDPDPARYMFVDEGRDSLRQQLADARETLAAAPAIAGHRRLESRAIDGAHSASRPSIAATATGEPVIAWVEWQEGVGEHLVVSTSHGVHRIESEAADCFRPTAIVSSDGTPWVFYGRSTDGEVAVHCSRFVDGAWTSSERVSETGHPSFNQEAAAHGDGSIEVTWQGRSDDRFHVFARRWVPDAGWGDTRQVDDLDTSGNVWDPVVAAMPDGGSAYAWCGYSDGRYRVHVRRSDPGGFGDIQTIDHGDGHTLHPSIAAERSGRLWCAFDSFVVPAHGGSGPTQLRHHTRVGAETGLTGLGKPGLFMPPELVVPIEATVGVVEVGYGETTTTRGTVGRDLHISPSAYPRLTVSDDGGLSLAYRILRRLPMMTYHWEVAVQHLEPDGWGPPITFESSDGSLEEASVTTMGAEVAVAWTTDSRAERNADWADGFGGLECPDLREHYGEIVWHSIHDTGRIRWGRLESAPSPGRQLDSKPTIAVSNSRSTDAARYRTDVDGVELGLYWGDLHRHSLISRCTSGDEPAVDDMYRYAWDVSEYDFWALTDHSENSTAFQWWTIQKAADLFHVQGRFVPFYGYEWTSPDTGHQNVIFDSARRGAPILSSMATDSDTPAKLWRHLRRFPDHPSITIPHHPGSAMVPFDWSYRDDDMVRLVEIFQSCRGSYESDGCFRQYIDATLPGTFVFDALRSGHRFGLIGSSDHGYGTGYLGAYAPSLDRPSIFEAFQSRRTIAATRRDIVVDARIGRTFMGGETTISDLDGPVEFTATTIGYADIARVEVLKNGIVAEELAPELPLPTGWVDARIRVEWGWGPGTTDWTGSLSVDGGVVVRTEYWSPEVTDFDETRVHWVAVTTSFGDPYGHQRGGVDLTVAGPPDALVRVETRAGRVVTRIGTILERGVVDGIVRGEGTLRIQPGVGGLVGLGTSRADIAHVDDSGDPGWFVGRVILTDGEMAWSSPIWVDR
jgi:hypothetical protein